MKLFYSIHARERMSERFITNDEVKECLDKGLLSKAKNGNFQSVYDKVRVIFEYDREEGIVVVVTAIPSKSFEKEVQALMKQNKVSYRVATKILKKVS